MQCHMEDIFSVGVCSPTRSFCSFPYPRFRLVHTTKRPRQCSLEIWGQYKFQQRAAGQSCNCKHIFSMRSLENASDGFLLVSLCRRKCVVEAIVLYVVTCLLCEWNLVFHFKKKTSGPANSVVSLDNLTYDQRVIGKHVAHGGKEHIGLIHTKLYVVCWLRSCWLPKGMITYQYGE